MKKHSVTISGHRTSISLEDEFWAGLKEIASGRKKSLADIIRQIDKDRGNHNLSSAIRLAVLNHYKSQIPETPLEASGENDRLHGRVNTL